MHEQGQKSIKKGQNFTHKTLSTLSDLTYCPKQHMKRYIHNVAQILIESSKKRHCDRVGDILIFTKRLYENG